MSMKWEKRGLVFGPKGEFAWAQHTALQPTPILLNDETIRVFIGMRDEYGISRIGFVDLNAKDPQEIKKISNAPVLNVGQVGAFDDNGVVPSAIVYYNGLYYLYYAGYSLLKNVRFSVLGGLAISEDGENFSRFQHVPIFERTEQELLFRVPHSVIVDNHCWRMWYGGGSHFIEDNGKTLPVYDIRYVESPDGKTIPSNGKVLLTNANADEHRVARPYVIKNDNIYKMFMCVGTISQGYRLGYAESCDGIEWTRNDEKLGLALSKSGFDNEMMAYPSVIKTIYGTYLFYNGNAYGKEGFGLAVLSNQ